MNKKCDQCGEAIPRGKRRFCGDGCKIKWHNKNRTLTPNLVFDCKLCGAHVEKWVAPSRLERGADTGEFCGRTCAGVARRGANHFNWKGGVRKDKDGYVLVWIPSHPHADAHGCVRKHRLVMEKKIGRYLEHGEVVHHKDDNPSNNLASNLVLYSGNAEHKKDDYKGRKIDNNGRFLPKEKESKRASS